MMVDIFSNQCSGTTDVSLTYNSEIRMSGTHSFSRRIETREVPHCFSSQLSPVMFQLYNKQHNNMQAEAEWGGVCIRIGPWYYTMEEVSLV